MVIHVKQISNVIQISAIREGREQKFVVTKIVYEKTNYVKTRANVVIDVKRKMV